MDYLVKKSYSQVYGARNLRRQIQKDLEDREDFVSYQISGYRSDKPETIKTRHFTLQLEQEGDGASLWRYSMLQGWRERPGSGRIQSPSCG